MRYTFLIALFLLATPALASDGIFLSAEKISDGTTVVTVQVAATTTAINALEGELILPKDARWFDVRTGSSVVRYWLEAPSYSDGKVSFSGIMPGGFVGTVAAGGLTGAGTVFSIRTDAYEGVVALERVALYLNDGEGTKITLPVTSVSLSESIIAKDAVVDDRIPPSWVAAERISEQSIPMLALDAVDKETGVAYFEVREGLGTWTRTSNTYVLTDTDAYVISIRAYDYAGNYREMHLYSPTLTTLVVYGAILLGIVLLLLLGYVLIRRRRTRI